MSTLKSLFFLYLTLTLILVYPITTILIIVYLNYGVTSWLILTLLLAPPTLTWYIILKRRVENYLALLFSKQPQKQNITQILEEYKKLCEG